MTATPTLDTQTASTARRVAAVMRIARSGQMRFGPSSLMRCMAGDG